MPKSSSYINALVAFVRPIRFGCFLENVARETMQSFHICFVLKFRKDTFQTQWCDGKHSFPAAGAI